MARRAEWIDLLDPSEAKLHDALPGEIHERAKEGQKAVGMYERGLELEPQHARLKEALARAKALR